jgi:hypothetical protein
MFAHVAPAVDTDGPAAACVCMCVCVCDGAWGQSTESRLACGDELRLIYPGGTTEWSAQGRVIKIPNSACYSHDRQCLIV